MSDTIRAFIAIKLPENIIASIGKIQEDLRSDGFKVKWVRPENIHLTLKFLGNINRADTEKIGSKISESVKTSAPLSLNAKGIGVFPNIKRPRVIWTGVAEQRNQLAGLQRRLDGHLESIGFAKEKRPFKGHLTIARIKQRIDSNRLMHAMKKYAEFESETFIINEIVLFKSELNPTGAVYTPLMSAPLKK